MTIINSVIKGGGSAPAYYIEKDVDANGKLVNSGSSVINLTGVTDIGSYVLIRAYESVSTITGNIDFSSLTQISGNYALSTTFSGCTGITSVDLSSLTKVTGKDALAYTFYGCTGITSVDLSSLTEVTGEESCYQTFYGCTGITSIDLSSLKKVTGKYCFNSTFYGTNITSINLGSLEVIGNGSASIIMNSPFYNCPATSINIDSLAVVAGSQACYFAFAGLTGITNIRCSSLKKFIGGSPFYLTFYNDTNLTTLSFPAITTTSFDGSQQLNLMCSGVADVTIHFPSNVQSVVEGLTGYSTTAPFGATAGTVLFDLPATNLLTGVNTTVYERNPKYDTATALAWRVQDTGTAPNLTIDWTPFYTSGLTDPTVGTTIYSDSACTVAVTTVDSIA